MAAIDYSRLRDQALTTAAEEAVTVNTRALIDKVLARYSGEFTTLRELIQNAADAQASKVSIRFETLPSVSIPTPQGSNASEHLKHVIVNHTVQRLVVTNNGQAFGRDDWDRLKRIAEGNPDMTKIGAFGVGFYSVFADCENPFVISGKESMAFFWKGNSLYTKSGTLDNGATSDTTFVLDYRNTSSPVPELLPLCRFLASSLTFVGLEQIELWLDDVNLLTLTKKSAPSADISIPKDINAKTREDLMKVVGVEHQTAQIDAVWVNAVGWTVASLKHRAGALDAQADDTGFTQVTSKTSWFTRIRQDLSKKENARKAAALEEEKKQKLILEDLAGTSKGTMFLRVSTVNIQTYASTTLAKELERATKKPPPKHSRIAILTSSHDETSASLSTVSGSSASKAGEIFAGVLPTKSGKVYIGFPTAQTTGLLAHISANHVIPTVERENIDLNARYVSLWNTELLRVAGIACRIAYAGEMANLQRELSRALANSDAKKIGKAELDTVIPKAIHICKQFSFTESTPSSQVGQIIEEAFWSCDRFNNIDILSSCGVLPSKSVRFASETLSFVQGIPVIPQELVSGAEDFINKLWNLNLVSAITVADIRSELEKQALEESQLSELLKWLGQKLASKDIDDAVVRSIFRVTVVTLKDGSADKGSILTLDSIDSFVNPSKIPPDMPLPPTTIPYKFTKPLSTPHLTSFGWDELQIVPWLRFLLTNGGNPFSPGLNAEQDLTKSSTFAAHVLAVISKSWDALSQSSKSTVVDLLSNRTIMPTKLGMKRPPEAYFPSVRLFTDLPTLTPLQGVKEKFLVALGVRKTVELNIIFERLAAANSAKADSKGETIQSHVDLIQYLSSVKEDIPDADMKRLRVAKLCPSEDDPKGKLYPVADLFVPDPQLRILALPILYWPGDFKQGSREGRFLLQLGLRLFPSAQELVDILVRAASSADAKLYEQTMAYLLEKYFHHGYNKFNFPSLRAAFVPVEGQSISQAVPPYGCFADERAAIMGYPLLRADLRPHATSLGVALNPPMADCVNRLIANPPQTKADAKLIFSYFSGRLAELQAVQVEKLAIAPIVPTVKQAGSSPSEKAARVRHIAPRMCFLGDASTYGDIFDFVDFGQEANSFLLKVGSKHEPSSTELAQMLVREPAALLSTLGVEKYLQVIRKLAESAKALKANTTLWTLLKTSSCLLGYKEIAAKDASDSGSAASANTDDGPVEDDEQTVKHYQLATVSGLVIQDDYTNFSIFRNRLVVAPDDVFIEQFYMNLGVPLLSTIVDIDITPGPLSSDHRPAAALYQLVLERSRLFLHNYTPDQIAHDARWLEKSLSVQSVKTLSETRYLRPYRVSQRHSITATVKRERAGQYVLYITPKYDIFDVSYNIVKLLLKRQDSNSPLAFENILTADLRKLRNRGFNVNRILRRQEEEYRVAEAERKRQLEEERRTKQQQEEARKAAAPPQTPKQIQGTQRQSSEEDGPPPYAAMPNMPGGFENSPEQRAQQSEAARGKQSKRGLFSNLSKQLGFKENNSFAQGLDNLLEGPDDHDNNNRPGSSSGSTIKPSGGRGPGNGKVTSPEAVHENLLGAIQASRSHDSPNVFSRPRTNTVEEVRSYCDSTPAQDISFAANSTAGVKFFLANSVADKAGFLERNRDALTKFSYTLLDLASVFALKPQAIHIFYDDAGSTIAFNQGGSLFFNMRYFLQLHWAALQAGSEELAAEGQAKASVWWWVVLCHEIAHNLVAEHSSDHSYYTESLAQEYFFKMAVKVGQYRSSVLDI